MTAEEYWNSEGIRFLNEDGTLPTVEDRVKEGYVRGWENGWNIAWETRDEMDKHRGNPEAAAFQRSLVRSENENERLREELAEIKDGMKFIMDEECADSEVHCGCVPLLKISFKKSEQEVARLRELLNLAIEIADHAYEFCGLINPELDELKAKARLAPATEVPVIRNFRITEPAPEWRIKEKGEIIEADDQYNSPMAGWVPAPWVGEKIETAGRIRTRRPLPKQEEMPQEKELTTEWRELGPDETIKEGDEYKCLGTWRRDSELKGMKVKHTGGKFRTRRALPKQEEMPLEQYIDMIDTPCDWSDIEARHITATCLRYLRDEIQKLKEAK